MQNIQDFVKEVEKIKNEEIGQKEKNSNDLYSFSRDDFSKLFLKLLSAYIKLIKNSSKFNADLAIAVKEAFIFTGMEIDFSYYHLKSLISKTHPSLGNFLSTEPFQLITLNFLKCRFIHFNLDSSLHFNLITAIDTKNSVFQDAILSSNSFDHFSFYSEDCVYDSLQFRGNKNNFFKKPLFFKKCYFKYKLVTFNDCIFQSNIDFIDCNFGQKNSVYTLYFSFNNSQFLNSTQFYCCSFYQSPKFHNAKIHSDTSFHLTKFHDTYSSESVGDYRALKQLTQELGSEHDFMKFHALEMESRRNTALPKIKDILHPEWTQTVASWFLKAINDYGRNFWSPWFWLIISFLFFAFSYFFLEGIGCNEEKIKNVELWVKDYCKVDNLTKYKASLVYSFQRLWGPLGLAFDSGLLSPKYFYIKLISIIQFILSSTIWFVLIVQMRRQFRL